MRTKKTKHKQAYGRKRAEEPRPRKISTENDGGRKKKKKIRNISSSG